MEPGEDLQALREREEQFRLIAQSAPVGMYFVGFDGLIGYANPRLAEIFGRRVEELVGTHAMAWLHPDDVERVNAAGIAAQDARADSEQEFRVVRPGGEVRWVWSQGAPVLDDTGAVRGYLGSIMDVTQNRASEAARHRSEAALRAIVQSSPLALFATDRAGRVHVWNAASERLFARPAGEVLGTTLPFMTPELEELFARVFAGERITRYEARWECPDGEALDVEIALAPLRNAEGRVVSVVTVAADITEQKRARELRVASEQRFRSLFQHSQDMVAVIDRDGAFSFLSPSAAEFWADQQEITVGSTPTEDLLEPDEVERITAFYDDLRARPGTTATVTFRLRRTDGTVRTIEMVATNLLDDPAVEGIVTNSRDITDRVDAAAAVRASEERLRALVASVSDIISVIDADGILRYSSPAAQAMLGFPEDSGYGQDVFAVVHPQDRARARQVLREGRSGPGVHAPIEVRLVRADGSWVVAEVVANNLLDDPAVHGIVLTTRDITQRRRDEEALRASEQRLRDREAQYRAVVDDQVELVCRYLPDTTLTFVNRAFAEFYGHPITDLVGSLLIDLYPPAEREEEFERLASFGAGREVSTEEGWEIGPDGSAHWYQWTDRAFLDEHGAVVEFQSVGRDVTERRRAAMLTAHQADILEQVARGMPLEATLTAIARMVEDHFPRLSCAVSLIDTDANVLRLGAAPTLSGRFAHALDGLPVAPTGSAAGSAAHSRTVVRIADLREPDGDASDVRGAAVAHGIAAAWSWPVLASDGHTVLGTLDVFGREPQLPEAEHEQILSLVASLASIAIERKQFEDRLAHQSMHDPLTGLPNRLLFLDRLGLAVARCSRTRTQVAVLFLDLDRFKNVNDSIGHDAGDELLVAVARRLETMLRPGDTVARFGGDEFVVLCEDLPEAIGRKQASEIAERLLAGVTQPVVVRGTEIYVGASIGIALTDSSEGPDELLRDADAAMYHAKESGRGRVTVFDDTMRERALVRHETENALHRALERGEFLVFFQPIVSLHTARCVGAEALVRWLHPERGLVTPGDFVPLAEETGLVVDLGMWVLEQAAAEAARWQLDDDSSFVVSVNLSARQLAQPDLVAQIHDAIGRSGVTPSNLCLEITESVLMDDAESVIGVIDQIRSLGVTLAIDDFGTGYSSLGYLKRFRVDKVKIDRSFVDGLGTDPGDAAIVSAVIGLAHALDLTVVAEGVETEGQLTELLALGCDEAQGYFFAPPQPQQDIRQLLGRARSWRPPGARLMTSTRPRRGEAGGGPHS